MKKIWKIVLGIVLVLFLAVATVVIWQWDNINAFYMGIVYDEAQIEEKLEDNKKKLAEALKQEKILDQKVIDGFSKEDEEKITKGEMTVDEAISNLFDEESVVEEQEQKRATVGDGSEQPENPAPEVDTKPVQRESEDAQTTQTQTDVAIEKQKQLIQTAVREIYILKAQYLQKLGNLERTALDIFYADGNVPLNNERKFKIIDEFMPQALESEKECDARVEEVLQTLEDGLEKIGKDASIVDSIRQQYSEEKKLQKTKYINEYLQKQK